MDKIFAAHYDDLMDTLANMPEYSGVSDHTITESGAAITTALLMVVCQLEQLNEKLDEHFGRHDGEFEGDLDDEIEE